MRCVRAGPVALGIAALVGCDVSSTSRAQRGIIDSSAISSAIAQSLLKDVRGDSDSGLVLLVGNNSSWNSGADTSDLAVWVGLMREEIARAAPGILIDVGKRNSMLVQFGSVRVTGDSYVFDGHLERCSPRVGGRNHWRSPFVIFAKQEQGKWHSSRPLITMFGDGRC